MKPCLTFQVSRLKRCKEYYFIIALIPILLTIFLTVNGVARNNSSRLTPATQRPYIIKNKKYYPIPNSDGYREKGIASWYGPNFHGKKTSNGEVYNMYEATAAHKLLPMNTLLLVKNLQNNKETVVRINDRGPFVKGRIIDLSYRTANELHIVHMGTAKVEIVALGEVTSTAKGKRFVKKQDFTHGRYYVQIGSFTVQNNAITLKKKFIKAGHSAVIQRYFAAENTFYRVQVYVGSELDQARIAEKILLAKGYRNAFLIAR